MKAVESIRHGLALAVRVDDHFSGAPVAAELSVTLDGDELPVRASDHGSRRHDDGTYRFLAPTRAGLRQLTVSAPDAFPWTSNVTLNLPLADRTTPVVIELWPRAHATVPPGALAVRGRLAGVAAAPGQEVRMEAVGSPPRNKRTRADDGLEFLFLMFGPANLTVDGKVVLAVSVPGHAVQSIELREGTSSTTTLGASFGVLPGRAHRVVINLT